jgi:hypothetical protein
MPLSFFKIVNLLKIGSSFLSLFYLFNISGLAEARTLNSSSYFIGKYRKQTVYGVLNDWDGRACTVINNKITIGQVSKNDRMVLSSNREVKIVEMMLLNPYSASQIPKAWTNNPKFSECYDKMLYAQCFIRAGIKYYKSGDENFRGIIKTRKRIFSIGGLTNSYTRDEEIDSLEWASFSFNKPDDSTDFIVNYKYLNCKNK